MGGGKTGAYGDVAINRIVDGSDGIREGEEHPRVVTEEGATLVPAMAS